jgi:hypothetical protein
MLSTKPELINLPKFLESRGNLSLIESNVHIPFQIMRTYWIYDIPGGESRNGHAYKLNKEFIVALSGSFDIVLNDGHNEHRYSLNRSYYGLYIPNMFWRSIENFSTNSVALVLADCEYDENDYIRELEAYKESKK